MCVTVVHLTALRQGNAVKCVRSDNVDLPEPLRRFSLSVNFAEGQVVIARGRLLVRSLGATLLSDAPIDSDPAGPVQEAVRHGPPPRFTQDKQRVRYKPRGYSSPRRTFLQQPRWPRRRHRS